jgi:phosphoglycerate dehydrogenase-like enzyme
MTRPKVVLWRPMFDTIGHKLLEEGGAEIVVVDTPDPVAVMAALPGARGLFVRTPERVTADILDAGPELIVVSTSGFGTDNVDLKAATERGVLVVNHRGFGRIPVSEHAILLILAAAKRLVWGDAGARDGSAWGAARNDQPFFELGGKTVGLLGLGHIGSELARKLTLGFRCRVVAYDPYVDPRLPLAVGAEMAATLDEMLGQAQVLCLVPELTDETRNVIGARELAKLPKDAVVVNVGRGQVLQLDALAKALDSGHLLAAGIDVYYPEPPAEDHPLLRHPKAVLTPHIAGLTAETARRSAHSIAEQLLTALRGDMPRWPVNPDAWRQQRSRQPKGPLV